MLRFLSIICLFSLFFFSSCEEITGTKFLKLGHGLDVGHPVHKGLEFLAQRVKEKSAGKLQIEIYPNQQLGTERQCLELLQIGSLAMTKVSGAVMESFAPRTKVLSLPYIFRGKEHAHQVFDSKLGKDLLVEGEKYWLRGLAYLDAGQRSFFTKDRPVRTPADLEGLKIRVQESVTAMNLVRALGASPTPISMGELYTSLESGVVDGAENNPPTFHKSNLYLVCKYYSLNEHTAVPDILVIGTVAWNRLSEQEQAWLQEASDETVGKQRELWAEAENEALRVVQEAGVEVIRPDKEAFMDLTKGQLEAYKNSEPEIYQLIQDIQAIGQ